MDWLVVDVPNCLYRAYHGEARREPAVAACSMVSTVLATADYYDTPEIVWCFDAPPYKRRDLFPGYKSKRENVDELEAEAREGVRLCLDKLWLEALAAAGFSNVFRRNGYEADDLIAAVVAGLRDGDRAILMSNDRDLYQLLSARCAIHHPCSKALLGVEALFTAITFKEIFGVKPNAWPTVKAIAGCPGDTVPGVDGVGEKTACSWLKGELKPGKKLKAIEAFIASPAYHRNQALVRLPYTGLDTIVPTPDPRRPKDGFRRLCDRMGCPSYAEAEEDPETRRRAVRSPL